MASRVSFKVLSFNVSGAPDLQRTADKFQSSTNASVVKDVAVILKGDKSVREQKYRDLMDVYMSRLLEESPDLLCLQELTKAKFLKESEHAGIPSLLKSKNYTLLSVGDSAVAYKTNKFSLLASGPAGDPSAAAYFSDLKFNEGRFTVRVVSDHPDFGQTGTASLSTNIKSVDLKPVSFTQSILNRVMGFIKKPKTDPADLIVYGLDANGTKRIKDEETKDPGESREWQPERTELFEKNGYLTDPKDENPTIKFHEKQKIDHIFVKPISCSLQSIKSIVKEGLNNESILDDPQVLPASDHLPVFYEIEIHK